MKASLLTLISVVLFSGVAHGKECSSALLNGSYSLYASGTVIGVGPVGHYPRFTPWSEWAHFWPRPPMRP